MKSDCHTITQNYRKQKGAALLVSMVMIFLLTLMGITSMQSATLDKQMVTNAVQSRDVFQAAESSNIIVLNDDQNLNDAISADDQFVVIETNVRGGVGMKSQVTLRYVGDGNPVGASLNAMDGANSFDAMFYIAEGVATVDSIQASRRIDQGATRTVPSQ